MSCYTSFHGFPWRLSWNPSIQHKFRCKIACYLMRYLCRDRYREPDRYRDERDRNDHDRGYRIQSRSIDRRRLPITHHDTMFTHMEEILWKHALWISLVSWSHGGNCLIMHDGTCRWLHHWQLLHYYNFLCYRCNCSFSLFDFITLS